MPRKLELNPGDTFHGWIIVKEVERHHPKVRRFLVKCPECGKEMEKDITGIRHSQTGLCISCKNKKQWTKHGYANHPLYYVLKTMHIRCENPKHHKYYMYGERGIKVCDEWSDTPDGIANFIKWSEDNGYKEGLVIDRIDNNKGYSPDNCRWTTYEMNNFNVRRTKGYRETGYGTFEVYITKGKTQYFKTVKTEEEAIALRKQWEIELYGENSPNYREDGD